MYGHAIDYLYSRCLKVSSCQTFTLLKITLIVLMSFNLSKIIEGKVGFDIEAVQLV